MTDKTTRLAALLLRAMDEEGYSQPEPDSTHHIADRLIAAGVAPAPDGLRAAVRDWVDFGAGDGTEAAEADEHRLLERIVAEYHALAAQDPEP